MARRTKLTPGIYKALCEAVALGVPIATAATATGVEEHTVREWIARGEGRDPIRPQTPLYASFARDIKKARAQDELRRVRRLEQAAQGGALIYEKTTTYRDGRVVREVKHADPQWTPDAWHLERSRPETWGRRDRLDLTVSIQAAAAAVAGELGLSVEEILAEATALLGELDAGAP